MSLSPLQVSSCYPEETKDFALELSDLLDKHYAVLNSSLRQTLVKALILLRNRNQVSCKSKPHPFFKLDLTKFLPRIWSLADYRSMQVTALQVLPLFFRLFKCQDKSLRQLVFRHIISGKGLCILAQKRHTKLTSWKPACMLQACEPQPLADRRYNPIECKSLPCRHQGCKQETSE